MDQPWLLSRNVIILTALSVAFARRRLAKEYLLLKILKKALCVNPAMQKGVMIVANFFKAQKNLLSLLERDFMRIVLNAVNVEKD